jgi:hypothetical protein
MKEIIELIAQKHLEDGIDINPPATLSDIVDFEGKMGFRLQDEFNEFYLLCNGFACNDDIFNINPLSEIRRHPQNYGDKWFYFADYMISSDMWGLRLTSQGQYQIFNASYPEKVLTSSLKVFLKRFITGNVFDKGGLYEWHEELGINK